MRTLALSIHADYRCGRTGACCTSGWNVGVEPDVEAAVRAALREGRLRVAHPEPLAGPPGDAAVAVDGHGRCAFFVPGAPHACAIHGALGHDALPVSCRQFPRVALLAPAAVRVSLSHYCPTAAALLAPQRDVRVVEDPPAFPPGRPYEGLDARAAHGPLLRPGVLLGWDAHAAWEEHAVTVLSSAAGPEAALERLRAGAEALRGWTPARGPLPAFAARVLADGAGEATAGPMPFERALALHSVAVDAVPAGLPRPGPLPGALRIADRHVLDAWDRHGRLVGRYLAARAFGAWMGLQGDGLRTTVHALEVALAVLRVEAARRCWGSGALLDRPRLLEAVRATDLLLLHLASPEALARRLSRVEAA